ncbi:MAG: inositol monophosphatase family protein [Desulfobacteraceae bacterium]|jgi:myo-inositol-1(or 4)-monophosphatase|nr:inositol monophosphatase family protein [Desulfobacteraceae bacterium]
MDMDLNLIKNTGIGAAYKSADIINSFSGKLTSVKKKGPIDLVTEADLASEKNIIETIHSRFPEHEILAEESGLNKTGDSTCQWIVDPLDGTTNFAHQIPIFAVSIAFAVNNEIKVGIVLNPVSGELFTAVRGQGATLNGKKITVSKEKRLSESLLVTGFPYDVKQMMYPLMLRFKRCIAASRGIRRLGSAALDLCFVACGRFEGFWEENLKPWDTAAGWIIAEEAGARITDFSGAPYTLDKKEILATNCHIHNELKLTLEI